MPAPLRLGLVGTGAIARTHIDALRDVPFARLTAVADLDPKAAAAAAGSAGCVAFGSHRALAESGICDAVIVCTPPSSHETIAIELMGHGLHVLCEKPLSPTAVAARRMRAAAEANGVLMTMASKFRYVEDVARARGLITAGVLGDVLLIENAFTSRVDMAARWNADPAVSGGGVLMDNGTHSVDIARFLLGPIQAVLAVETRRVQPLQVEDTAFMFLRAAGGVTAHVDLSWSLGKGGEDFLSIHGTQGVARIGWRRSHYRRHVDAEWTPLGTGYDKVTAFRRQAENFCNAVNGIEPLLVTPDDAVASVDVIDAAYRSLRLGRWTEVRGTVAPAPIRLAAT